MKQQTDAELTYNMSAIHITDRMTYRCAKNVTCEGGSCGQADIGLM